MAQGPYARVPMGTRRGPSGSALPQDARYEYTAAEGRGGAGVRSRRPRGGSWLGNLAQSKTNNLK